MLTWVVTMIPITIVTYILGRFSVDPIRTVFGKRGQSFSLGMSLFVVVVICVIVFVIFRVAIPMAAASFGLEISKSWLKEAMVAVMFGYGMAMEELRKKP